MPANPPGTKNAQKNTWGGFNTASVFSGNAVLSGVSSIIPGASVTTGGYDLQIASGAGRLDQVTVFPPFASGQQNRIIFYDAATVTSGGPFPLSGHKVIGYIPDLVALVSGQAPISGNVGATSLFDILTGVPRQFATPYQSGLCVALKSGQPGFTVSWTPETPNM